MFLQPIQMWGNLKDNGSKDAAENKHQKMILWKLQQSFKKKGRKTKPGHLQKSKIIWKQNIVGAAPQTWGPPCSFWPVSAGRLTAVSAKQWSTMWRWNGRFRTDGSTSDWKRGQVFVSLRLHLRTAAAASLWLTESGLKGWKMGAIKCVQSLQCEARTLLSSERIRCDFPPSLSELSKPPC